MRLRARVGGAVGGAAAQRDVGGKHCDGGGVEGEAESEGAPG